jgi:hypothetical protein
MQAAGLAWYKPPRLFEEVPTISNATFVPSALQVLTTSLALFFVPLLYTSYPAGFSFQAYFIASHSIPGVV